VAGALDRIGLTMRHALTHSDPTLEDLKEVRVATECHLARTAARRRTPEDVAALRAVVAAQERAAGREAASFTRLNGEFHAAVAAISGNPVFASVVGAVFDWLSEFHVSAVHRPGLEALTVREHREIVDAVEAGRAVAAHRAMARHLERANALYETRNRLAEGDEPRV
jgi:DNA-binding FadR family transcriptional regulator